MHINKDRCPPLFPNIRSPIVLLVYNAPSNSKRRGLLIVGAGEYSAGL